MYAAYVIFITFSSIPIKLNGSLSLDTPPPDVISFRWFSLLFAYLALFPPGCLLAPRYIYLGPTSAPLSAFAWCASHYGSNLSILDSFSFFERNRLRHISFLKYNGYFKMDLLFLLLPLLAVHLCRLLSFTNCWLFPFCQQWDCHRETTNFPRNFRGSAFFFLAACSISTGLLISSLLRFPAFLPILCWDVINVGQLNTLY